MTGVKRNNSGVHCPFNSFHHRRGSPKQENRAAGQLICYTRFLVGLTRFWHWPHAILLFLYTYI